MIAADQSLDPLETLEDGGGVIERNIFSGEIPQVPDGVGGLHKHVPLRDQLTVVRANVGVGAHRHVENASVAEMGIAHEPVRVVDQDGVGAAHGFRLPLMLDLSSCRQAGVVSWAKENQMHQILATVVGAVLGGFGFLARRFLERDPLTTVIDRRLRLVSLHQRMKAAGLTEKDLIQLERGLSQDEPGASRTKNAGNPADSAPDPSVHQKPSNHSEL